MKLVLKRTEPQTTEVDIPVDLSGLKWSATSATGHARSLSCGICGESIGDRPFAMAYAKFGNERKAKLVRLCQGCGKKAEA